MAIIRQTNAHGAITDSEPLTIGQTYSTAKFLRACGVACKVIEL